MKSFFRGEIAQRSAAYRQRVQCLHTSAQALNKRSKIRSRQRWRDIWFPQANLSTQDDVVIDATQLLIRAGYLRQAYSGIFHMLPLGLRVQQKLEKLIDKHMSSLQASKVSLSSISSQKLWDTSGRLGSGSEFFKFQDRKDAQWLLAPTHEEEITTLVKDACFAPDHLPLRLYQISRKYRDEKRPRGGLLRGREFIMKDLYTFDKSEKDAHATYDHVRLAYRNFFNELKLPYVEARADSGNMGGNLSHEYHFPSPAGEDNLITCTVCNYARNEEFVPPLDYAISDMGETSSASEGLTQNDLVGQTFLSKDKWSLVKAFGSSNIDALSSTRSINPFAVKACLEELIDVDTGIEDPQQIFLRQIQSQDSSAEQKHQATVYYLFDQLGDGNTAAARVLQDKEWLSANRLQARLITIKDKDTKQSHLIRKQDGDACPDCSSSNRNGKLKITKAIEVGHTFHLGSRYSSKFDFIVPGTGTRAPFVPAVQVSMGCHGIGVSRMIAAITSSLADPSGLNWPRAIAPFEAVIVFDKNQRGLANASEVADGLYDQMLGSDGEAIDVLIDDRENVSFGWKLKDADLIGYPVIIVIGKSWVKKGKIELQCRRLKVKEDVDLDSVPSRVKELLAQL